MLSLTKVNIIISTDGKKVNRKKKTEKNEPTVESKLIDICLDPTSKRRLIVVNTIDLVVCLDAFVG